MWSPLFWLDSRIARPAHARGRRLRARRPVLPVSATSANGTIGYQGPHRHEERPRLGLTCPCAFRRLITQIQVGCRTRHPRACAGMSAFDGMCISVTATLGAGPASPSAEEKESLRDPSEASRFAAGLAVAVLIDAAASACFTRPGAVLRAQQGPVRELRLQGPPDPALRHLLLPRRAARRRTSPAGWPSAGTPG